MKLTDLEKSQVRGLVYSPQWAPVQKVAEDLIIRFRGENTLRDTEWETLRDTIKKEGKAQGLEEFFQELLKESAKESIGLSKETLRT